ncbi:MAG: branched-chain amino acid transport system II carrier protein, partial [Endozoicomonas sp.]
IARVGGGFNEITRELPRILIIAIGSCIYLIIGPLYAVPRTAMVAYEVGIAPFLEAPGDWQRLLFSLTFFVIAWYLSIRPGKLLESVGKLITPALIILLVILGVSPILAPQGTPGEAMAGYQNAPVITGFLEGYMTMDALAALMFGVVIITNLRSHGIHDPSRLCYYSITTGVIAASGLALVYLSLFYLGATSSAVAPDPANGGQILTLYVDALFGTAGKSLLAGVVTLACLTTAIGCITAASEYFDEMIPNLRYTTIVTLVSIVCVFFANLGLNQIIALFIPALLILYPVCIVLIFLGLFREWIPNPNLTYRTTLLTTGFMSLIDALKTQGFPGLTEFLAPFSLLPGYDAHLSWLLPAGAALLLTGLLGLVLRPDT